MNAKQIRCLWSQGDPLMQRYHDEEWGVPDFDSRSLWETLMLEGFQAGLSWITVLRKRDAFRKAFRKFDPKAVARLGEKDIAKMLENPEIIRSRAKIEATINGARVYLDMQAAGEFSDFAWQFVEGKPIQNSGPVQSSTPLSITISKELKTRMDVDAKNRKYYIAFCRKHLLLFAKLHAADGAHTLNDLVARLFQPIEPGVPTISAIADGVGDVDRLSPGAAPAWNAADYASVFHVTADFLREQQHGLLRFIAIVKGRNP